MLVVTVDRPRAGRHALRMAAAVAGLPGDPVGYRFPHPRASVTHTGCAGAAAVLVGGAAVGVGVDLEHDQPVPSAGARFYLHDDEPHDDLLRLWTVKEALFKADPANGTRLVHDYRADDPAYRHVSSRQLGGWLTVAARLPREQSGEPVPVCAVTFEAVASRVAGVLRVPEGDLTPQAKLRDLSADSFMLVIDLQEAFDAFSQARLREAGNLGELVELLQDPAA